MFSYSQLVSAIVQDTQDHENTLSLINEGSRSQLLLHPQPTSKVFLLFHGFTATPEQFAAIGKMLFESGYNVLIPLQPGHGRAGDWGKHSPPPLPEDQETYLQFAQQWLERVQDLGEEVFVGGLSSGATISAWLGLEHPQWVDRALLFAPYLRSRNRIIDFVIQHFNIYFKWRPDPGVKVFGYKGFFMPALRLFVDMGQMVMRRAKQQPAVPMLIVSSPSDRAINPKDPQVLFEAIRVYHPQSKHYCFDEDLQVPHNMMTKAEGNQHVDQLLALVKDYIES